MLAFLSELSGLEKLFAICAIGGGVLFVFRLVLMLLGGDSDAGEIDGDLDIDVDMDMDIDVDADIDVDGHVDAGDTDISFKLLSLQALMTFFMMFGLVGLALLRQSKVAPPWALLGASAAGVASVWIMKKIYMSMKKLQSAGNIRIKNAIGQVGTVYLTIPSDGTGKVRITIQDHLKVYDAISEPNGLEIKTDQRIQVVRVTSGNILVVTPAE